MKSEEKELLVRKRAELVENLNVRDGLFTQLISRKVLNKRMVGSIKNARTTFEQAEELLDILPTRGPESFSKFCESLIADDQEHIVTEYLTNTISNQNFKQPVQETNNNTCKRKRSPSPTIIYIKDSNEGKNLQLNFLSENPSFQKTEVPIGCPKPFVDNEIHYSLKHFITQPQVDKTVQYYIPVPKVSSLSSQCSESSLYVPSLLKCDSVDAFKPSTSKTSLSQSEHINIDTNQDHSRTNVDSEQMRDTSVISGSQDGPMNVQVENSSRQFYISNYKQSYPMKKIPRGKALIINVKEVIGKSIRKGTDIDRDNLHMLLLQLHFDVVVFNDEQGLNADEMFEKIKLFSQLKEHEDGDACFVGLLSHGEEGYIFGNDGQKVALNDIFALFDNQHCPYLREKPKIFIIQACRGGEFDKGINLDETDGNWPKVSQLPTMSDFVIGFPTQAGYYAWRNREKGSWYIQAIVQVFMKYAKDNDVCTLLNRVNSLVSKRISGTTTKDTDGMCQMSEYKITLRKPYLYFFPGIGSG